MHTGPAVSVIVPTCNRPALLRRALDSLAAQRFKGFEVVVINDGEEDVSGVTASFGPALAISLLEHPVKYSGLSAARNSGVRAARGAYIGYLDDDDTVNANHLSLLYYTARESGCGVVYSDTAFVFQSLIDGTYQTYLRDTGLMSFDFDPHMLSYMNITPVMTVLHRKDCLKRTTGFATYLRGHEDWDLWQRIARHHPFLHIPSVTADYYHRDGSGSLSSRKKTMAESWLFVRQQGFLFDSMPPVYELEKRAADAHVLSDPSPPCEVSLILGIGNAASFLGNGAAVRSLKELCAALTPQRTRARLLLSGHGEAMPQVFALASESLRDTVSCLWTDDDAGRVLSANAAADLAGGRWLLFLEPFVSPEAEGWLDALLAAAQSDPSVGVVGGGIRDAKGRSFSGGKLSAQGDLLFQQAARQEENSVRRVDCVPGFCFMIARERFLAAGGFDPAFAMGYYADADLCLRLQRDGYTSVIAPEAAFLWNQNDARLCQSPAGLVSRRLFWDRWIEKPFPLDRLITGSAWPMRPEGSSLLWPSEGVMPHSFDVIIPEAFRS